MDPTIDIKKRMTEHIAGLTRQYFDNQRARPGPTGRSPDGTVEVTLNGLGDVTEVRVRAKDLPEDVASRLAQSFKAAWQAAAGSLARAETEDNPLAQRAGMAELVEEQIAERYGPPPQPTDEALRRPARSRDADDDDYFGEQSVLR